MRVLFAWHAAVEPEYRKLFYELVRLRVELLALLPKAWTEGGRLQRCKASGYDGYRTVVLPVIFRDRIKRFFYPNILTLAQIIKRFRPNIMHIFEEPYSLASSQLVGLAYMFHPKAKIIVQSFENLMPRRNLLFNRIERFVLHRTHALLTVPHEGEVLWSSRNFKGPIYQVPIGLDEDLFQKTAIPLRDLFLPSREGLTRIGYVGRLVPAKGVSLLLQAFHYLLKDEMNIQLLIVGNGNEKEALKLQAKKLGIIDHVFFVDPLPSKDLPLLYSHMDILVLPSKTTEQWKEQFGRVLVEAMACEVAVVGSSSGEIPWIVGDAGAIFPESDVAGLTMVLRRLVSDSGLREKMSKAGRKRVLEKFTWKYIAKQLYSIYKEVDG